MYRERVERERSRERDMAQNSYTASHGEDRRLDTQPEKKTSSCEAAGLRGAPEGQAPTSSAPVSYISGGPGHEVETSKCGHELASGCRFARPSSNLSCRPVGLPRSCGIARLERGLPQEGIGLEAGNSAGLGRA